MKIKPRGMVILKSGRVYQNYFRSWDFISLYVDFSGQDECDNSNRNKKLKTC